MAAKDKEKGDGEEGNDDDGDMPPWALALIVISVVLAVVIIAFAIFKWRSSMGASIEGSLDDNMITQSDEHGDVYNVIITNLRRILNISCNTDPLDIHELVKDYINRCESNVISDKCSKFVDFINENRVSVEAGLMRYCEGL